MHTRGDEKNPCDEWGILLSKPRQTSRWLFKIMLVSLRLLAFHGGSRRYRSNIECRAGEDRLFTFMGIRVRVRVSWPVEVPVLSKANGVAFMVGRDSKL